MMKSLFISFLPWTLAALAVIAARIKAVVAAIVMQAAGEDATAVKYIAYDAGGAAMAGLLSGEIQALSTGFSEAVAMAKAGEVKILGVTAPERVDAMF